MFSSLHVQRLLFSTHCESTRAHTVELRAAMWVQATWCSHFRLGRFRCERIGTHLFLRLDLSHLPSPPTLDQASSTCNRSNKCTYSEYSLLSVLVLFPPRMLCIQMRTGSLHDSCPCLSYPLFHFLQRQSLPVLFEQLLIDLGGDLVQVNDPQGPFHQTPGLGPVTCVLSEGVSVLLILLPLVLWSFGRQFHVTCFCQLG